MFLTLAFLAVAAEPLDWEKAESPYLHNIRQVTRDFVRAGEGYFSPDGKKIIFQAEEKEGGNPFYQIFVMDLETGKTVRVSPGVGKTTCSYFSPDGKQIIFASSHLDPDAKKKHDRIIKARDRFIADRVARQLITRVGALAHTAALEKPFEEAVAYTQEAMRLELFNSVAKDMQKISKEATPDTRPSNSSPKWRSMNSTFFSATVARSASSAACSR